MCSIFTNSVDPDQILSGQDGRCLLFSFLIGRSKLLLVIWLVGIQKWVCQIEILSRIRMKEFSYYYRCRKILKPGGHLVIVDTIDNSWYAVGNTKFKTLATTEEEIRRAFSESGYEIEEWETYHVSVCPAKTACDATSMYSVVAKKL